MVFPTLSDDGSSGGRANGAGDLYRDADAAYLWACMRDVAVFKPGNVSLASAGHGMAAVQFLSSAAASAGPLLRTGAPVGARIEGAVVATRAVAGCNTNLGIVLLCAPVALAAERAAAKGEAALLGALGGVLDGLDVADACAAYRAIALASPGGLGNVGEQDVSVPPTMDLKSAMALAADRDMIARQYARGFDDLAIAGLRPFLRETDVGGDLAACVQRLFLRFLSAFPDSHIVRKSGLPAARSVQAEAAPWLARLERDESAGSCAAFTAWDASLKQRGLNPGTSADLTVCTLFMAALLRPALIGRRARKA
ncbi:triphosphoribosyl-dephospho-CoA synthase [Thauera sinica]|uniref:Triphosphoribosyl-dephospho-CoA synthase n=1 Tax=Thauera sinica TaxID=2665146 RepID=A0ABW1ALL9_9RHOO|nr:triphosphoribosyl-dephospho-CoA synthase [Thauera sp. K11]ATE60782.1 triphosphoribosyl-dephospho-CoA synthase [Thauera sp. K11]